MKYAETFYDRHLTITSDVVKRNMLKLTLVSNEHTQKNRFNTWGVKFFCFFLFCFLILNSFLLFTATLLLPEWAKWSQRTSRKFYTNTLTKIDNIWGVKFFCFFYFDFILTFHSNVTRSLSQSLLYSKISLLRPSLELPKGGLISGVVLI